MKILLRFDEAFVKIKKMKILLRSQLLRFDKC